MHCGYHLFIKNNFDFILLLIYIVCMKEVKLTLSGAANFLRMHTKTLQKMDRDGRLKAYRTETNRRYYLKSDLEKIKYELDCQRDDQFTKSVLKLVRKHYG